MPKMTPKLWFDTESEEAANFYVSVFPNSSTGFAVAGDGFELHRHQRRT
jgi:predicted 3-demethylubiquinone-9 3-methyltransferase (glyoxalase superfamily)